MPVRVKCRACGRPQDISDKAHANRHGIDRLGACCRGKSTPEVLAIKKAIFEELTVYRRQRSKIYELDRNREKNPSFRLQQKEASAKGASKRKCAKCDRSFKPASLYITRCETCRRNADNCLGVQYEGV